MSDRRKVFLAASIGFIVGFVLRDQLEERKMTPEKALKIAKETFRNNWPINSSWIYAKPERIEKNGLTYETYRGGITRNIDGKNEQFGFYIDIETGAIIDLFKIDV